MSTVASLPWWAAVPVAVLLVLGGLITLLGTLGLLRLQTFYQRIHGPAITTTLGAGCILVASMVYFTVGQSRLVIHELLISVFVQKKNGPARAGPPIRQAPGHKARISLPIDQKRLTGPITRTR